MTYYLFIKDSEIIGKGQCKNLSVENYEVDETLYNDFVADKYIIENGEVVLNPDYDAILEQKEAERISMLSLTAADVERAIYKAKGIDFEDVIALVEQSSPQCERAEFVSEGSELTNSGKGSVEAGASVIDIKALKIELKANNFYRGNPYIDAVGSLLGFTKQQLDEFFETNDYTKLVTNDETADTDNYSHSDVDSGTNNNTDIDTTNVE